MPFWYYNVTQSGLNATWIHKKTGIITGMLRFGHLRTTAEKFRYGICSTSHQSLHAISSLKNNYGLEKIDAELEPNKVTILEGGNYRLNKREKFYYDPDDVKEDLRRIDHVKGYPCLWVPSYFVINEDTGRIQCHSCIDRKTRVEEESWDEEDMPTYVPGCYHFLNLSHRKLYHLEMNLKTMWRGQYLWPDESICVGSSRGWLAFMNCHHGSFYLFNPLITPDLFSYPFIPLPPIETLPTIFSKESHRIVPSYTCFRERQFSYCPSLYTPVDRKVNERFACFVGANFTCPKRIAPISSEEFSRSFIKKVVLSSSPTPFPSSPSHNSFYACGEDDKRKEEECLAMLIHGYGDECQLAFCKIGDTKWTHLEGPRNSYQDIAYFSKDRKFYALTKTDHLEAWDLSCPSSPKMTLVKSEMPAFNTFIWTKHHFDPSWLAQERKSEELKRLQLGCKRYLVDCSGELLMLVRYFNTFESNLPDKYSYKFTDSFIVYKLLLEENRWIRIKRTLGGRSMFVGINECIVVRAADYPGLKEDCIYFNCVDAEIEPNSRGAYDLGIFDLKYGEIHYLYKDVYAKILPNPVWILPQL